MDDILLGPKERACVTDPIMEEAEGSPRETDEFIQARYDEALCRAQVAKVMRWMKKNSFTQYGVEFNVCRGDIVITARKQKELRAAGREGGA